MHARIDMLTIADVSSVCAFNKTAKIENVNSVEIFSVFVDISALYIQRTLNAMPRLNDANVMWPAYTTSTIKCVLVKNIPVLQSTYASPNISDKPLEILNKFDKEKVILLSVILCR